MGSSLSRHCLRQIGWSCPSLRSRQAERHRERAGRLPAATQFTLDLPCHRVGRPYDPANRRWQVTTVPARRIRGRGRGRGGGGRGDGGVRGRPGGPAASLITTPPRALPSVGGRLCNLRLVSAHAPGRWCERAALDWTLNWPSTPNPVPRSSKHRGRRLGARNRERRGGPVDRFVHHLNERKDSHEEERGGQP